MGKRKEMEEDAGDLEEVNKISNLVRRIQAFSLLLKRIESTETERPRVNPEVVGLSGGIQVNPGKLI